MRAALPALCLILVACGTAEPTPPPPPATVETPATTAAVDPPAEPAAPAVAPAAPEPTTPTAPRPSAAPTTPTAPTTPAAPTAAPTPPAEPATTPTPTPPAESTLCQQAYHCCTAATSALGMLGGATLSSGCAQLRDADDTHSDLCRSQLATVRQTLRQLGTAVPAACRE